jgi:hypothetical protein
MTYLGAYFLSWSLDRRYWDWGAYVFRDGWRVNLGPLNVGRNRR